MNEIREAYARDVKPALAMWQQTRATLTPDLCLTHNDFHPANVLYRPDDAPPVMLDLEQTRLAPCSNAWDSRSAGSASSRCDWAALAVLAKARDAFIDGYMAEHPLTRQQLSLIPDWIRAYELEKVLRILRLYLFDGLYPQNVRKLLTHHIPLVREAAKYSVT